jgi:arsenite-transporting ATPase
MKTFLNQSPRHLFFTGKGGVGKTTTACATALSLAARGDRVLLVSTDPASNLDEVLGASLGSTPCPVPGAPGLEALNVDPEAAARAYREKVVGPYRGVLPDAAVQSIEEQLSGVCTVEIAAFGEFARLLGEPGATAGYSHVVFDTAPTGHTLRLLELPAAWTQFIDANEAGTSCLGPLSGLREQEALFRATLAQLSDREQTAVVLVARPDPESLAEAERSGRELAALGLANQRLVLNGVFAAQDPADSVASAWQARVATALANLPSGLAALPRSEIPLKPFEMLGLAALRRFFGPNGDGFAPASAEEPALGDWPGLDDLLAPLRQAGKGVVMTMGKGGVGKTTVAAALARALAQGGTPVHLTTTDPAAHVAAAAGATPPHLTVSRIDPKAETRDYAAEVLATAGKDLDDAGRALLEEDLRSPCTEEIAVFRAFAREVARAEDGFVVIDTAPTGHTLLLLDAAEAYHREVSRSTGELPEAVRRLLPRLRDPAFTRILLVALPEATPVHEAAALEADLRRAGIEPYAWVLNQSLTPLAVTDPLLRARRRGEARYVKEVSADHPQVFVLPWSAERYPARESEEESR